MNELKSKKFNMFESTTTHFMKKHENFRNLKKVQEEFEKTQTKRSILFKHEQNETSRQQVDQEEEAKCLSLNINEIEVKMIKLKLFKKRNLRDAYHSIRLTTKKANIVTFYKKYENSTQLTIEKLKQRLLRY